MDRFNTLVSVLSALAAYNFARQPAAQAWTMAAISGLVILILCVVAIRKASKAERRVALTVKVWNIVTGLIIGGTFHWWNPWT